MTPNSGPLEGIAEDLVHSAEHGSLEDCRTEDLSSEVVNHRAIRAFHAAEVNEDALDGVSPLLPLHPQSPQEGVHAGLQLDFDFFRWSTRYFIFYFIVTLFVLKIKNKIKKKSYNSPCRPCSPV